jgi:hypothetical protein
MRKFIFLLIIVVLLINSANAQDSLIPAYPWREKIMNSDSDYYQIQMGANQYFEQMPDSGIYRERKFFNRADYFLSSRVNTSDSSTKSSISNYNKAVIEKILNQNICSGTNNNANWQFTGPIWDSHKAGIVTAVYSDPATPNIIYAGTNASGLWKTDDGGNTWTCLTDQLRIPGMGVQCITVDRNNPERMLVGTGISTYSKSYGVGVLISEDAGESWEVININGISDYNDPVKSIIQGPAGKNGQRDHPFAFRIDHPSAEQNDHPPIPSVFA